MKTPRLPYLQSHLRQLNYRKPNERKRWIRLFPLACLSLACGFAVTWRMEQRARLEVEALLSDDRIEYRLKEPFARPVVEMPSKPRKDVPTDRMNQRTVDLLYRSETDSGITLSENERGLKFEF